MLVAMPGEFRRQNVAEIVLRRAIWRAIVVRQVEMGYAEVECSPHDRALLVDRPAGAEVLPQAERDRRQLEPASTAASIAHFSVSVVVVSSHRDSRAIISDFHGGSAPALGQLRA